MTNTYLQLIHRFVSKAALILLCMSISSVSVFAENIAVIVNAESPIFGALGKPQLEIKDIKNIYLGNTRFWGSSFIKPAHQSSKEIIGKFIEKSCRMSINDYQYHWVKFEFDTGTTAPKVLDDAAQEMISYVQQEKTAIGYVWENDTKGISGIKTILLFKL